MTTQMSNKVGWILDELLRTPHTLRALLLSADGLRAAWSEGFDLDLADRMAAAVSGLQSVSSQTAPFADCKEGPSNLALLQWPAGGYLFVMAAGNGSHLAVGADGDADVEKVSYSMEATIDRLGKELGIAPRATASDPVS